MNSLQIGLHWFPERAGGLDRVYHSLIQSLPKAGFHVRGLIAGGNAAAEATNGTVRSFSAMDAGIASRLLRSRSEMAQEMRHHRPDVVAVHFALYAVAGLSALRGVPLVMHFHGPWADESNVASNKRISTRFKTFVERRVYHRADKLIVLSKAFRDVLVNRYGVDAAKIQIVPGCVDVSTFDIAQTRAQAREATGLPQNRPIVFCVRRLVSRMGLEDLIDAMKLLRAKQPDVLLLIAGKGPLSAQLQERVDAAGLSDTVRLMGYVSDADLPLLYRAADLSVVPTVTLEGFGLITVESLSAGTPVLVTPVGGLPEAVQGLSEHLVLKSTGAQAIAEGLDNALSGRTPMPSPEACLNYARNNFDLPVIAGKVARVYEEAIAARRRGQ